MASRKDFLARAASAGAFFAAAPIAARATDPPPVPAPSPAATKAEKAPSEAARALASRMRQYDPKLSDSELDGIAHAIDDQFGFGKRINPHGTALANGDEPAVTFAVNA